MIGITLRKTWWSMVSKMLELMNWCTRDYFLSLVVLEVRVLTLSIECKQLYHSKLKEAGL